jgi:hypothetical protein
MEIELINENEDHDSLLLNKFYSTKLVEDEEISLNEIELTQKKEIWDLSKMETMVSMDETLSNKYNELAIDGPFKFGYHWNEVIMNLLFNEYVLEDPRYMEKYLNTIAKEKKRRGNPDRKIGSNDFKKYKNKEKKHIEEMEINENTVKTVRDMTDEYELISNSQDVEEYKKYIGTPEANEYDTFFVKFTSDGSDVEEIWGMQNIVPMLSNNVYLIYPTGINETTSSASSGQFSGPFMWAKDKKSMRLGKKPIYLGGAIVEGIKYYESIQREINEDRKTTSIINKERIGKENAANFKRDLTNNNIKSIVNGYENMNSSVVEVSDVKSHEDIEKDQITKMKDFKPVKHERTDEYNKQVQIQRGYGMQDIKYDIEPSEKFVDRAKEDMTEEIYDAGQEKIEMQKNRPMYNKDVQPTSTKAEFDKKITESIKVFGKYKVGKNNKLFEFDLSKVNILEGVNEDDFLRLFVEGIGNIYDKNAKLNESVKYDIDNYNYYINIDTNDVVKTSKNINEKYDINLNSFAKLANYSSQKSMKG